MAGRSVIGLVAIDVRAAHGPWNDEVVLAPADLVASLSADGAQVVIVPSEPAPVWHEVYSEFSEIVVQDESEFALWFAQQAEARGLAVRRA